MILATQSDFFRHLLYNDQFMEAKEEEVTVNADPEAFAHILDFIYTGVVNLSDANQVQLIAVLELAHRFGLADFEAALIDLLIDLLNLESLHLLIRTATLLDASKLKEYCGKMLSQLDGGGFFVSPDFLQLDGVTILDLFSYKHLTILTIKKFEAIANWLHANPQCKALIKVGLLKLIDLSALSNAQIMKVVAPKKVFEADHLLRVMGGRDDVIEEVRQDETSLNPFDVDLVSAKSKAVYGKELGNIFKNTGFTESEYQSTSGYCEINIDLGSALAINHLEFVLGNTERIFYSVCLSEKSPYIWAEQTYYYLCSRLQKVYFKNTLARFVQIRSNHAFKCNAVKLFCLSTLPRLVNGRVSPAQNFISAETAFCEDAAGKQSPVCTFPERGFFTNFTAVGPDGMMVFLNQIYVLRSVRLRLWDFDGRKQSFTMELISYDLTISHTHIVSPERKDASGWENFIFNVEIAANGFKISPLISAGTNELRIVCIESSGELIPYHRKKIKC